MTNKLKFLTKMSLDKKIKTKWFLIANLIFAVMVIGLINIDSVIKFFGGDFDETQEILVIDEVGVIDAFETYFDESSKYLSDYVDTDIVEYTDLTINLTNYSVHYLGKSIDMPPKELELLYFLASSPNHVFTREQLLDHIWGYEYIGDTRTVDVHIKRLREKIHDHAEWRIATVWGIGYRFEYQKR